MYPFQHGGHITKDLYGGVPGVLEVLEGGGGEVEPDAWPLFVPAATDTGVLRYSNQFYLLSDLGSGRVAMYAMGLNTAFDPAGGSPEIGAISLGIKARALDESDARVTLAGTWTGPLSNNTYWGGDYYRTIVAGSYIQFTTGASATQCGVMAAAASSCGVGVVSIDGDNTLATSLPTAQTLVDAGQLAASVLVANGGTLNPTDRIFDNYKFRDSALFTDGMPYFWCEFATGLAAGEHVVRLTATAYYTTGGSANRLNICGLWDNSAPLFSSADCAVLIYSTANNANGSRWEFATLCIPAGAVGAEWIGHGGTEFTTTAVVAVDGAAKTMEEFDLYGGAACTITLVSYTRHTELVGTDINTINRVYTMTTSGLRITGTMVWNLAATATLAYLGMLPGQASWNRGRVGAGDALLLTDDNDSYKGSGDERSAYIWEQSGNWGGMVWVTDATINSGADAATRIMSIQDRTDELNKIYPARIVSGTAVAIAEDAVWTFDIRYRVSWFSDAEAALA